MSINFQNMLRRGSENQTADQNEFLLTTSQRENARKTMSRSIQEMKQHTSSTIREEL